MKRTALKWGASLLTLLAVAASAGCGDKKEATESKGGASMAITSEDKFKVPPGADPSVPAELGGGGFEKIAADSGWQTSSIPEDQIKYISDQNAKKGGMIRFSFTDFPATLRSMGRDENTAETRFIYGMVYETLIDINPMTLEFLPLLATHWKVGADKQTYYFRIDPNARFSDGHPVTTADVIATDKLGRDSSILSPYTNSFHAGFDPPVALSKYIFSVRSKTMNWKNMFYFGGSVKILPAHLIEGLSGTDYLKKYQYNMLPGTGPYMVAESDVVNGKSITLTRRTNWWQGEYPANKGLFNFDKINIVIIRDENLQYEKFRAGEIDVYVVRKAQWWKTKFDFEDIQRGVIQKRKVYTDDPVGFGGLGLNARKAPFDDPKVREAMMYLFNRDQILEKILYNEYVPTYSYYPNSPYENPNNPKYKYDPVKAGQLLAEAGWTQRNAEGILVKNGKPFVVEMPTDPQLAHIVTPIQQDLMRAGIKLTLRNVDPVTQFKLVNDRNFDLIYFGWGGILYPNPISSFKSDLADQKNTNNITGFKNKRADEIIDAEQITFDQAQRVAMLQELDSILVASHHWALNWHAPFNRIAYWNKFGQPEWYLGKVTDWQSVFATWWIDPEKEAEVAKARKDKAVKMEVGPTEIKFWPEYNQTHKPQAVNYLESRGNDTAGKSGAAEQPSIK